MRRRKTSRRHSNRGVLRALSVLLLTACAAAFAGQVVLCQRALDTIPMLLEYPELGETPPLTLEVFQRRVGKKAEASAAWQGQLTVELPGDRRQMTARVALSNWGQVAGLALCEGEFYPSRAVLLRQYQAVVPEGVAAAGQRISVEGVEYTVCGVYRPEGAAAPLYLSSHPSQANQALAPNRMLLAQNDRLRLSVLYDLQAKANYTPGAERVDLGLWRQLLHQEVYGTILCCAVLLCGGVLLRGCQDAVRLYGRWAAMLAGRRRALVRCLARLIFPVAALNVAFCGVNLPAELLPGSGGQHPVRTALRLAQDSDYLPAVLKAAEQLAGLGGGIVLLFGCGLLLWHLAACKPHSVPGGRRAEDGQSVRWRYHKPADWQCRNG